MGVNLDKPSIGKAYRITLNSLKESVSEGKIVGDLAVSDGHACYSCLESIVGPMYVVKKAGLLKGKALFESSFYLHDSCYHSFQKKE